MGVMAKIGIEKLGYSSIDVRGLITKQSPDIAMGVDKGGAGDQGIMYGYATNETAELLPMPFAVATTFIQKLEELDCPMFMPDAKAQVSYDYDTGRITTFLCSVQHDADADIKSVRKIIRSLICGHVHDELIIECSKDVSLETICEQMGRTPPWIKGLLLRADGYECDFYKKD